MPLAAATPASSSRFSTYAPRPGAASATSPSAKAAAQTAPIRPGFVHALGMLVGLGLVSPFYKLTYSFGSGAIGLFILFWGMQYAWKAMAAPKVNVDGPFSLASQPI